MVIILRQNANKEEVKNLITGIEELGVSTHVIEGEQSSIIGLVGDTTRINANDILANEVHGSGGGIGADDNITLGNNHDVIPGVRHSHQFLPIFAVGGFGVRRQGGLAHALHTLAGLVDELGAGVAAHHGMSGFMVLLRQFEEIHQHITPVVGSLHTTESIGALQLAVAGQADLGPEVFRR